MSDRLLLLLPKNDMFTVLWDNDGVLVDTEGLYFQATHPVRPGTVVVIPAGVLHSLEADPGQELEFVIFGTPPMPIEDERARPRSV